MIFSIQTILSGERYFYTFVNNLIFFEKNYILKIDPTKNQHDLGVENGVNGIGYYQSIYQKHQLPQSNNGQFYHPPLHYIISSLLNLM